MGPLQVVPDIRKASTPPPWLYTSPSVAELQAERVFARSWQVLDHRPPSTGHVLPLSLLAGCLDEPLLWTSFGGGSGSLLSNICTHRGHPVCAEEGMRAGLRCPYHGRRFRLDGACESAPGFAPEDGFPGAQDHLPRLPLEQLGPLHFTSTAPTSAFEEWMAPVLERVAWMPLDQFRLDGARSRDFCVAANWALYCENYLEGLHIPFVHRGLNAAIDLEQYDYHLFSSGTLQTAYAREGTPSFELPPGHPDLGRRVAAWYFWLFPNLMLNFYPWGLSLNLVQPEGPTRTRVAFRAWVWKEELMGHGAGADLETVEQEDEAVVEAVQASLSTRLYRGGRYSPSHEAGTHHFHRLLAAAMGD